MDAKKGVSYSGKSNQNVFVWGAGSEGIPWANKRENIVSYNYHDFYMFEYPQLQKISVSFQPKVSF